MSKGSRNTSDFNIFRLVKLIRKPSMSPNIVQVRIPHLNPDQPYPAGSAC